ncbi:MAG TPA: type I methionyl aminopeptidase [Ignavibacteriaceae bacterium]|uniref:Methionine aminopeptidase n=3 Tax=environmental samples TaxID=1645731 RepID=A0A0H4TA72_9BACT|nr:map, Methionine aminopeptidase, methionyl aminopeptidase [uncultured Ignavibacteria bacterium Rifle_16ft_4_minimus_38491]AKQ05422.1 map, Methionine aminopeptidase, methionyl aminopeptidase [uncultured Ignavibacteria bacterium Rifle_16ft_4_minimus_32691]AKQ05467.1 map, Methionine aminopeptidase, methionyl aminopeptidase [uncultured Ignavibacteria bacterium Rifle_16ft_4_minimus_332]
MIYIKTKKEIDYIRESCRIVAETLKLVANNVQPGVTTIELDRIAEEYIFSNNAKAAFKGYSQAGSYDYPASICVSIDDEVVHGIPGERVLKEGEIVSIDVGVLKNGYFGDAALSVAVGKISSDKEKLLEVTEKSLYEGIKEAKVNNRVHDISFAVQNYVEANGFSVVKDLCGHGVGKYLHEEPAVPNYGVRGTGPKLKKGMTIAIEPMVNTGTYKVKTAKDGWTVLTQDGLPSAHFEHTILVSNGSPEILTVC